MWSTLLCEKWNKKFVFYYFLLVPFNSTSSPTNYWFDEKKLANISLWSMLNGKLFYHAAYVFEISALGKLIDKGQTCKKFPINNQ